MNSCHMCYVTFSTFFLLFRGIGLHEFYTYILGDINLGMKFLKTKLPDQWVTKT